MMITIALVAHDRMKSSLVEWVNYNKNVLQDYKLVGTGTTSEYLHRVTGLQIEGYLSGPKGGDIELANDILYNRIDILIFFTDEETPQGHEHDINALRRTAILSNIPFAQNRATADLVISGIPHMKIQIEKNKIKKDRPHHKINQIDVE